MLILQLAAYLTVIQGGIEMAISRFVARAEFTGEGEHARKIIWAAGFLLVLGAGGLAIATLSASLYLDVLFPSIPYGLAASARYALLVVGLAYSINLPFSILAGAFQGHQRYEINALATSAGKMATAGGVMWTALHGGSLLAMGLWAAFGAFLQSAIYVAAWLKNRGRMILGRSRLHLRAAKEFMRFCSAMLATQFAGVLITGLDLPIVAAFDFHSAGYYAAAITACNVFLVPYTAILSTLIPVASGMTANHSPSEIGTLLLRVTRYSTALLLVMSLPLLVGMRSLLSIWLGSDYSQHTVWFAVVLVIAQLVRLAMFPYSIIGFGGGQQARMLYSAAGEALVNLALSLILVRTIGALGVAIGTLIGAFVGTCLHFGVSIPLTDCVAVDRAALFKHGIWKPLWVALPAALIGLWISRMATSAALEVASACLTAIGVALSEYYLVLTSEERAALGASLALYLGHRRPAPGYVSIS